MRAWCLLGCSWCKISKATKFSLTVSQNDNPLKFQHLSLFQYFPKPDLDTQCGAMCFQPARRCIYDANSLKYLVQTRDDVEAGDEKIKELESEMKECGLYDSDFSLGDLLDEGEEESGGGTPQPTTKKKSWTTTPQLKEMKH